jgi:hypothetical protein
MGFIHRIQERLFRIWRVERHRRFVDTLRPAPTDRMVDVGGYPGYWASFPRLVAHIDCVNLHAYPWDPANAPQHSISTLIGNGCALTFPDGAYDIAFSNSVIEHVGDLDAQRAFAREMMRVGRRVWVQTPAYECPIEPHFLAPFIHWFPKGFRMAVARNFTLWGWSQRPSKQEVREFVEFTRLMTKREFVDAFPGCEIITERLLLIFPKSYVAVRR